MESYRHTQTGVLVLIVLGLGLALTAAVYFQVSTVTDRAVTGAVVVVLALCLFWFRSLTVSVTADEIVVSFGPGVFRKRIRVADVNNVRAVRNAWYNGWGIRLIPHGWMYNVSGLDAVELDLPGDRRFRIGTDDPDGLLKAITSVRAATPVR